MIHSVQKKFKKNLDNPDIICYNKVILERGGPHNGILRNPRRRVGRAAGSPAGRGLILFHREKKIKKFEKKS